MTPRRFKLKRGKQVLVTLLLPDGGRRGPFPGKITRGDGIEGGTAVFARWRDDIVYYGFHTAPAGSAVRVESVHHDGIAMATLANGWGRLLGLRNTRTVGLEQNA